MAAADALARRILEIEALMQTTIQHRADLLAKRPDYEHAAEESLLSPDGSSDALAALDELIAEDEKRIEVIQATISRDRHSPELEKLAQDLWDEAHAVHESLTPKWSDLLGELQEAAKVYLTKVKALGKLAQAISRQEKLLNLGARPYIPGKEFFPAFDTRINAQAFQGPIFLDGQVALAYDPGHRAFTTADAMAMLHPDATNILNILQEK